MLARKILDAIESVQKDKNNYKEKAEALEELRGKNEFINLAEEFINKMNELPGRLKETWMPEKMESETGELLHSLYHRAKYSYSQKILGTMTTSFQKKDVEIMGLLLTVFVK